MDSDNEQPALAAAGDAPSDDVAGNDAAHRHLEDDLRALVDSGVVLVRAEVALQQARARHAAGQAGGIALLGGLALVFAFFALVALTVGLVIALTPLIGAIGATLAVFGGLLIAGLIAALLAFARWKRLTAALSNREAA